jgi:hypothetical protein
MRKRLIWALFPCFVIIQTVGCERLSRPNISGARKGSIEASDKSGHKWNGPAELTLNQNGDALTGSLAFTHPQGGRVQIPISSGVVSKDSVTFAGQSQFPMGGSVEITFHGNVNGTTLTGTTDMTSRGLFGPVTNSGPLSLTKQ